MSYNSIDLLKQYYTMAADFLSSLFPSGELEKTIEQQDPHGELIQRLHERVDPLRIRLASAAKCRAAMGDRQIRPWNYWY